MINHSEKILGYSFIIIYDNFMFVKLHAIILIEHVP